MHAARSRSRKDEAAPDSHEEHAMWTTIVGDLRKLQQLQSRAALIAQQQLELETVLAADPSIDTIDKLQELYREGVRLAEDEQRILHEEPSDVIKNIGILLALRAASETELPPPVLSKISRNAKRQKMDTDTMSDVSQAASPQAMVRTKSSQSASAPRAAEAKPEDPETSKGQAGERAGKFVPGAEVAYRQARAREDGSQWIQCNIISVTERGSKKWYEIQDPEPDETGAPGQIYKTSASALVAIARPDALLPELPPGKRVLARYPETTTFYRAEVIGLKREVYRLKFEDDQNQELEVVRRYVLDIGR